MPCISTRFIILLFSTMWLFAFTCRSSADGLEPPELEIKNLQSGLLSFDADDSAFVSKSGSQFIYQETGTCVEAGKSVPCIWHGFSFDYQSPSDQTEIKCAIVSDKKQNLIDPVAQGEKDVTESWILFV